MIKFIICLSLLILVVKCTQYSNDDGYSNSKSEIKNHLIELFKAIAVIIWIFFYILKEIQLNFNLKEQK